MKDLRTTNMLMVTALMLALAAMLAGPAFGRVVDVDGTTVSKPTSSTPTFDDKANLYKGSGTTSGRATPSPYGYAMDYRPNKQPKASPYGYAMDYRPYEQPRPAIPFGSQTARHNSGWFTGLEYADPPKLVQDDDGFNWGGIEIGASAALAALLLAAMATLALRSRDGGKPATS
jgi:hypothetical protein